MGFQTALLLLPVLLLWHLPSGGWVGHPPQATSAASPRGSIGATSNSAPSDDPRGDDEQSQRQQVKPVDDDDRFVTGGAVDAAAASATVRAATIDTRASREETAAASLRSRPSPPPPPAASPLDAKIAAVPNLLHFTFAFDLLEPPEGRVLTARERLLAENVRDVIAHHPGLTVRWWDDRACTAALVRHGDATLVTAFEHEDVGMFKGDLCRGVILLTAGGYYFDVDVQAMADVRGFIPADATFATCHQATSLHPSWERGRQRWRSRIGDESASGLFQAFIAAAPGHPVMRAYLDRLSAHYSGAREIHGRRAIYHHPKDNDEEREMLQLGVYAMGEVFSRWRMANTGVEDGGGGGYSSRQFRPNHGISGVHMFVEVSMVDHMHVPEIAAVPLQRGLGAACNYLIFDEDTGQPVAYSRVVGASKYCVDPVMNKPKWGPGAAVRPCKDLPLKAIQLGIPCT